MGLELYAKIEDMLCFSEQICHLHSIYTEKILNFGTKRVLDIGCGCGTLMRSLKDCGLEALGVDLSHEMVRRCELAGLTAKAVDICEAPFGEEYFDAAVAVFDVLNYMESDALKSFLACVQKQLKPGGYFIADINTLYGFEEIAPGVAVFEDESRFVTLDAEFDGKRLVTKMTLFEKSGEKFEKLQQGITQYYHAEKEIAKLCPMKFIGSEPIALYGDEPDKTLLVFQNS